ncbi:MAG: prenyltransferase [Gammaproteobacteria bacterium]|nr:prenyltransferase [Gammaproteobacteria bacterium]
MVDKTRFIRALRPFSFVVAVSSCLLGVVLAYVDGAQNIYLGALLVVTGLILQSAVNLINDYSDRENREYSTEQRERIIRNMKIGRALFLMVVVLGLYMVSIRGLPLLALGLVGILGAWGYTCGTINYKQRGLGVVLVFFLMGVMMIGGCYYTMSGNYQWSIFWLSIPFSLFTSLLLLANELRDFEEDSKNGIATLTVRIGFNHSIKLYGVMLSLIYISSLLLYWQGMLSTVLLLLIPLIATPAPLRLLHRGPDSRKVLPQLTGRLYFVYSAAFLVTLMIEPSLPI